tara:strand:- start:341 stop:493 length:153 start_codon:yes stop_codon:yes gene_type:complete
MPVYLRKFYLGQLIDAKKKENEKIEKANKRSSSSSISGPKIPNYSSRFKR